MRDFIRRLLLPGLLVLVLLLGIAVPRAIHHKNQEYAVARVLGASGLSLFDQAVVMTSVFQSSDFNSAAAAPDGRAGILLLPAAVAERQGLVVQEPARPVDVGFLSRWFGSPATARAAEADQRLNAELCLNAGIQLYLEQKRAAEVPFSRDGLTPAESAVAAMLTLPASAAHVEALLGLFASPEGEKVLATADTQLDSTWIRTVSNAAKLDAQAAETMRRDLQTSVLYIEAFEKMLPLMQSRPSPTLVEYLNSLKSVLVRFFGVEKWVMHLVLGLVFFWLLAAGFGFFHKTKAHAGQLAGGLVFVLSIVVEVVDWYDAVLNDKKVTWGGSLADIVVTCLLPAMLLGWEAYRRARRIPEEH